MLERVLKVMNLDNLTMSDFAKKIGVQSSQVSHVKNGRNQVTLDFVTKILLAYPTISPDWLIFGNGNMYRNSTQQTETQTNTPQKQPFQPEMRSLFDDIPVNDTNDTTEIELTSTPEITVEVTPEEKKTISENNDETPKAETKKEEPHIQYEAPRQSVKKIVVLYSDKTYEEFVPNPN